MIWAQRSNSATTLVATGLPGKGSFGSPAIRARLSTDYLDPRGIYLGTATGQLFYSRDDTSELMLDNLPPILLWKRGWPCDPRYWFRYSATFLPVILLLPRKEKNLIARE